MLLLKKPMNFLKIGINKGDRACASIKFREKVIFVAVNMCFSH